MAPRAYWKGYLRLSLVSCPIALFPATSEREKVSFNQINKETGNRVRYRKVDAETGDEVPSDHIIKGYEAAKVGQDAFVVIRDVIEQMKMVAIGRVVLTSREHIIAISARGKGLMGTLLRFPYEVRDAGEFFDA